METRLTRGAVVALLILGLAVPIGAQVAATGGTIQLRQRESKDTTELRAMIMSKARIDSMMALMAELRQLPGQSAEARAIRLKIDSLMPIAGKVTFRASGVGAMSYPKGWIGINAQGPRTIDLGPDRYMVRYFDYPAIISVEPESPAKRAGIVPGDVLLAYDGIDVKGHPIDLNQLLVPDKKLSVAVRHDGEQKEYTLTVMQAPVTTWDRGPGERGQVVIQRVSPGDGIREDVLVHPSSGPKAGARGGGVFTMPMRTFFLSSNGAFGAVLSTVSVELAKTLKLEPGVLVNDVTDETPASTSGLRPGDVIVNVGGQSVATLQALQETLKMRIADRTVVLEVVRDKKPRKITVNW